MECKFCVMSGLPVSCSMGTGVGNSQRVKLTTWLHLVPNIRVVELYLHSPIDFHGMVP
jgi:hypothetical protein